MTIDNENFLSHQQFGDILNLKLCTKRQGYPLSGKLVTEWTDACIGPF